jgi:hypothetical protein
MFPLEHLLGPAEEREGPPLGIVGEREEREGDEGEQLDIALGDEREGDVGQQNQEDGPGRPAVAPGWR